MVPVKSPDQRASFLPPCNYFITSLLKSTLWPRVDATINLENGGVSFLSIVPDCGQHRATVLNNVVFNPENHLLYAIFHYAILTFSYDGSSARYFPVQVFTIKDVLADIPLQMGKKRNYNAAFNKGIAFGPYQTCFVNMLLIKNNTSNVYVVQLS